ncbi:MAG: hypothetical protein ACOCQT_01835 [Desulfovermiculus sp.]
MHDLRPDLAGLQGCCFLRAPASCFFHLAAVFGIANKETALRMAVIFFVRILSVPDPWINGLDFFSHSSLAKGKTGPNLPHHCPTFLKIDPGYPILIYLVNLLNFIEIGFQNIPSFSQYNGLRIRRPEVRILSGAPKKNKVRQEDIEEAKKGTFEETKSAPPLPHFFEGRVVETGLKLFVILLVLELFFVSAFVLAVRLVQRRFFCACGGGNV